MLGSLSLAFLDTGSGIDQNRPNLFKILNCRLSRSVVRLTSNLRCGSGIRLSLDTDVETRKKQISDILPEYTKALEQYGTELDLRVPSRTCRCPLLMANDGTNLGPLKRLSEWYNHRSCTTHAG